MSSVVGNSPQVGRPSIGRKSMSTAGSPQQNDSHLYEYDNIERPYLPDCWTDTRRMTSLMASFRPREVNPEGWDLKSNFWANCITKWTLHTRCPLFTAEDVVKAFERGTKRPDIQCIQLVMSQMKRNKTVISLSEFKSITDNTNKNWFNWGLNTFVFKPISIGWNLVSNSKTTEAIEQILPEVTADSKFVLTQTLQLMSEELNKYINSLEDIDCIRFENLFHKFNSRSEIKINFENFEIVVNHLEYVHKLKVFTDNGIKVIKIGKKLEITESDIGLIRLEVAKEVLENDVEKLETEIETIREEAKVCVKNKNREKAILLLKKKKRVENKLNQKITQLDNVDVLIEQLLNCSSHNLVLQAFQRANEALKSSNPKQEDIENTMTDIEGTLDEVNELISDVSRPLVSGDTEDYEKELDELLNEFDDKKADKSSDNRNKPTEEELTQILDNLSVNDNSLSEREETPKRTVPLDAN